MSFGKELCKISAEAAMRRCGETVWESLKETLKSFAQETGERGCNIFFRDIPSKLIAQLELLGAKEEIEFINWDSPSATGHPGKPFEQIGVITWDRAWFFSKYPFKVSNYAILVSCDEEKRIIIGFIDT